MSTAATLQPEGEIVHTALPLPSNEVLPGQLQVSQPRTAQPQPAQRKWWRRQPSQLPPQEALGSQACKKLTATPSTACGQAASLSRQQALEQEALRSWQQEQRERQEQRRHDQKRRQQQGSSQGQRSRDPTPTPPAQPLPLGTGPPSPVRLLCRSTSGSLVASTRQDASIPENHSSGGRAEVPTMLLPQSPRKGPHCPATPRQGRLCSPRCLSQQERISRRCGAESALPSHVTLPSFALWRAKSLQTTAGQHQALRDVRLGVLRSRRRAAVWAAAARHSSQVNGAIAC
ncbi:hypothetical protein QJQ45_010737 [Haematococcus lacustris]|nr:hypothetical protein QJQ45_010737 [Haematococcus lacustris]